MKSVSKPLLRKGVLIIYLLLLQFASRAQGRVVVNEFMAWPGCNTTSEFIELLNFGPGPMNIGCYVVTNGKYAVTIPPNTILRAGQYYLLAGQDTLKKGCGNIDSTVRVNLNWTTCGCTNKPVPTTGDGFMQDGGNANEKIVVMDALGTIVDAVSRNAPVSASDLLITSAASCTPRTFDLDELPVNYEVIGVSTGNNNSYGRTVDGDCSWEKTTPISAGAPNKTGTTSSATYSFTSISATECAEKAGWISIEVSAANVASLFPMSYTLAYDKDSNGVFEDNDLYTYGVDNTAPSIDISNLPYGRYRITVASSMGCNLKNFDFFIFNCYGVVLPVKLTSFTYGGLRGGQNTFTARFAEVDGLAALHLEGVGEDGVYHTVSSRSVPASSTEKVFTLMAPPAYPHYRLKIVDAEARYYYSPVVSVQEPRTADPRPWPNPVVDRLHLSVYAQRSGPVRYTIMGASGEALQKGSLAVPPGSSALSLPTQQLAPGVYYLKVEGDPLVQPLTVRFIK